MVLKVPLSPSLSPQARREGRSCVVAERFGATIVRADAWARRPYLGRGWKVWNGGHFGEVSLPREEMEIGDVAPERRLEIFLVVPDLQPFSGLRNL